MNIKTSIALFLCIVFFSCQNTMKLIIDENTSVHIAGHIKGQFLLNRIFFRYLKDLDVFAGINAPEGSPPTAITDLLTYYSKSQSNFNESTVYKKNSGITTTQFEFGFQNIKTLFNLEKAPSLTNLISVKTSKDLSSLTMTLNKKMAAQLGENFLIDMSLLSNPTENLKKSREEFFNELSEIIADSDENIRKGRKEISNSYTSLIIVTPRPIISIQGGEILNAKKTEAKIFISLEEILFPEIEKIFSISF